MIHVALVGAGGMARHYRKAYTTLPDVEWSVAIDLDPEQLELCRQAGAKNIGTEFSAALAPEIDLVDISTPNHLHEEQAVAALAAGKHVLLQKPMANSLESADRILAAAKSAKGTLGMYMSSYCNPLVWEIKRIIDGDLSERCRAFGRGMLSGGMATKAGKGISGGVKSRPVAGVLCSFRFMRQI